jgi:hypothetical protein
MGLLKSTVVYQHEILEILAFSKLLSGIGFSIILILVILQYYIFARQIVHLSNLRDRVSGIVDRLIRRVDADAGLARFAERQIAQDSQSPRIPVSRKASLATAILRGERRAERIEGASGKGAYSGLRVFIRDSQHAGSSSGPEREESWCAGRGTSLPGPVRSASARASGYYRSQADLRLGVTVSCIRVGRLGLGGPVQVRIVAAFKLARTWWQFVLAARAPRPPAPGCSPRLFTGRAGPTTY